MDTFEHLERDVESTIARVQRLVDEGHAHNVRLTKMEDALAALDRIEKKVESGFQQMNGRVRRTEITLAVLQWAVGIIGVAAGTLWAVGVERLFGQ